MDYCFDCNKKLSPGAKTRCWKCHVVNLKLKAETSKAVCKKCKLTKKHCAFGMCKQCYAKQYNSNPEYRKKRAKQERKRRTKGLHLESERKRDKTQKRIMWKRKYHQKYYKENREYFLAYQREYCKDTPRQTAYKRTRMKRLRSLPSTLTPDEWVELLEKYEHRCYYCDGDYELETDHKLPASRGGGYTKENIVPSCGRCNRRKSTKTVDEYREYLLSIDEIPKF